MLPFKKAARAMNAHRERSRLTAKLTLTVFDLLIRFDSMFLIITIIAWLGYLSTLFSLFLNFFLRPLFSRMPACKPHFPRPALAVSVFPARPYP